MPESTEHPVQSTHPTAAPEAVKGDDSASLSQVRDGATRFSFRVVTSEDEEEVCIRFFCIPNQAARAHGLVTVEWEEKTREQYTVELCTAQLEAMEAYEHYDAILESVHRFKSAGKHTIHITTPSGYLSLARLPYQTVEICSPLPTLTRGVTDKKGRLLGSSTLPQLVRRAPSQLAESSGSKTNATYNALKTLPKGFLSRNPQLSDFHESFANCAVTDFDEDLFAACRSITDLTRTFAASAIKRVPAGWFAQASSSCIAEGTFADCRKLSHFALPFAPECIPILAQDFLKNTQPHFFACFEGNAYPRRFEMGYVRARATLKDPAFVFDWTVPQECCGLAQRVLTLWESDWEISGDILIDWGDGQTQSVPLSPAHLTHTYEAPGIYSVALHSVAYDRICAFAPGAFATAIHTPLPALFPRIKSMTGDFCGWCANARYLESLPQGLFENVRDITNLDEAFAGCVSLTTVPDDLLAPFENQPLSVDAMFAFASLLPRLPMSYLERPRRTELDGVAQ